ncbi:MAG: helix-hairpin-helix domain-containing protein, partial [Candidatus Omnitrophota bacterium]
MKRITHQFSSLRLNPCFRALRISESGSILVLTLWALIILSILGAALAGFIAGQIRFSNVFTRAMASVPLAKSAVIDAIYERAKDATPGYDSEKEMLKERERKFINNIRYKYHFEDEMAKVNINTASSEILGRLLGLDSDDDLVVAIFNSPRKPFKSKEELLLIEGMAKDKFRQFKDFITVHGEGKININTAPAEVLAALGLEKELIEIISRYRAESFGPDGKSGTDDDGAFLSPANVLADLREFDDLSLKEEQQLLSITS